LGRKGDFEVERECEKIINVNFKKKALGRWQNNVVRITLTATAYFDKEVPENCCVSGEGSFAGKVYIVDGKVVRIGQGKPSLLTKSGWGSLTQKAVDIINRLTSSLQVRPFDFIRRTDPAHLLNFIQQEHPQTIALILAYLEPQKASIILGSLPHESQSDVAKRIATMDRTSPETLREVERVLEKKLITKVRQLNK